MNPRATRLIRFMLLLVVVASGTSGCYYMQAARGQVEVLRKREPIEELVAAEATEPGLAARLRLVQAARDFSISELGLPDNDSYRSYTDLERDFVVWNVIAAPEFSVQPKRWCYPIVGCVSYRGYFAEAAARRKAESLRADGYDVVFGGVAAYSTLGRFDDPILNTMLQWQDVDIVAVMFHELAHQVLYIKDDTGFNESFATAVEEFGIERWLDSRAEPQALVAYRLRRELRAGSMAAVRVARQDLEALFERPLEPGAMRAQKQQRLAQLGAEVRALHERAGRRPPAWIDSELNNARLASMALYHGWLPAFRQLLATCDDDLQCFYAEATGLAELDRDARDARLEDLQAGATMASESVTRGPHRRGGRLDSL